MRRRAGGRWIRAAIVAIGAMLPLAAHAACLKANSDNQTAEGRLRDILFVDFAERKERAFILELATPACLDGEDEIDKVESAKRIHVYSMDAKLRRKLRSLVGKTVRVKGSPFGEHTVYHHAPIVMHISEIERL